MMKNDRRIKITLKNNSQNLLDLNYTTVSNSSAEIWFESLKNASEKSEIKSTTFYNFKNRTDMSIENLIQKLENAMKELVSFLPELGKFKFNKDSDSSLQKSLNDLHVKFAHSHLSEKSITEKNVELWSEFNALIHQIESALIAKNLKKKSTDQLDISRIEFFWQNNFQTPIPEICYNDFTLQKAFGSIQINYCQIGRHLHGLYYANDEEVPIEQIQPQRFFSANSTLWFGPDITEKYEAETTAKIHEWFLTQERKFNSAGIYWNRKDKALGSITVAQLDQKFNSMQEKAEFQNQLAEYTAISAVVIST